MVAERGRPLAARPDNPRGGDGVVVSHQMKGVAHQDHLARAQGSDVREPPLHRILAEGHGGRGLGIGRRILHQGGVGQAVDQGRQVGAGQGIEPGGRFRRQGGEPRRLFLQGLARLAGEGAGPARRRTGRLQPRRQVSIAAVMAGRHVEAPQGPRRQGPVEPDLFRPHQVEGIGLPGRPEDPRRAVIPVGARLAPPAEQGQAV